MPLNSPYFIYLMAAGIAVVIGLIIALGYLIFKKNGSNKTYEDQLQAIFEDEFETEQLKNTLYYRWSTHWGKILKETGLARYSDSDNTGGRDIIVISLALAVLFSTLFMNPLVGIAVAGISLWLLSIGINILINKKSDAINNQLPGFLFALKANIQANETPERALIKVVDSMPSPLYDDLIIVKNRLLANATFKEALDELSAKTSSNDLKFLAACMIQASNSGTNIEHQIATIQNVLNDRQKISNEISRASNATMPSILVSTFVIPGSFLVTYLFDSGARAFWFVNPISWIVLIVVAVLYVFGIYFTRRLINNIKNL